MAVYPIKMMKDESGQPFVPLTSLDAVIGEKNLQYILDAEELSAGHFRVNFKDLKMTDITNSIIVVRWPQITSTVKPSYLKLNNNTEAILYDGTGKEYMDLEDASGTINLLAYDGTKWIQATGSGSGGGHVITDGEGHSMEQQKVLSFVGFNVENDAANRATKIVNPTPINNLTTTESGQGSLDAYQGNILSKRSVPAGGTKGQVLAKSGNGDHQLEWINQDSDDVVTSDGSIEEIVGLTYEEYKALEANGQLKPTTQYHITDFNEENMTFVSKEEIQNMIDNTIQDIGTVIRQDFSIVANDATVVSTLSLTPGLWLATGTITYEGDNKRWYISLGDDNIGAYDSSGWVSGNISTIIRCTTATDFPMKVWMKESDGTSAEVTVRGILKAVRIR